jgi:hypothetical protein
VIFQSRRKQLSFNSAAASSHASQASRPHRPHMSHRHLIPRARGLHVLVLSSSSSSSLYSPEGPLTRHQLRGSPRVRIILCSPRAAAFSLLSSHRIRLSLLSPRPHSPSAEKLFRAQNEPEKRKPPLDLQISLRYPRAASREYYKVLWSELGSYCTSGERSTVLWFVWWRGEFLLHLLCLAQQLHSSC